MKKPPVPEGMTLVKVESLEALSDNIAAVAVAARRMDHALPRNTIVVLLQDAIPFSVGRDKINAVLDALATLDKKYLKPQKVKP